MSTPPPPRWEFRLENYARAVALLREAADLARAGEVSALEKEGIFQRFEYTWELSWLVLRDYLEFSGVVIETPTPRNVLREALKVNLIEDGDVWMAALDARNRMSHVYDARAFEAVVEEVQARYLERFEGLAQRLTGLREPRDG